MADPRVDKLEQQFASIKTMIEGLVKKSDDQSRRMEETNAKVDTLLSKGSNASSSGENSNLRNRERHQDPSSSYTPKLVKMDFPRYNGIDDPTSWICWAEQFFNFQRIKEEDKLPMAAYHLERESQMWYQLFQDSEAVVTWNSLKAALHTRYGPTAFEDHFGDLTKLQQTGTVREYQLQFEQLLSRVGKLSVLHQLGCFVGRLRSNLRIEVQAARPTTVIEAIGLARLYEARNWSLKKPPINEDKCTGQRDATPPLPSPNLGRPRQPPSRRLSPAEMQERRIKGLCFNCDEEFVPGHRCKKLFVIERIYTIEEEWEATDPVEIEDKQEDEPVISLYALTKTPSPQTMRVQGALGKLSVTVLMDSRSTHNFINTEVAKRLGLKPTHSGRMQVTMASGEKLPCTGMCAGMLLWLQEELFVIDFFLLPMDVCEVVLGTQWLRTLGPIWWDFERLQMNFS
jgi:hypothetical protein